MEESDIEEKVQIILRQTNFTDSEAREKLLEYNGDYLMVIKSYFGIDKNKSNPIISVNQEIYKQLRQKMDKTISEYSKRKETENSSTL